MEFPLIYFVFIAFGAPIYIVLGGKEPCPVGEVIITTAGGVCNGPTGDDACSQYCKDHYNATAVKSECVKTQSCGGKSECICSLKSVSASCAGDPHCTSFDNKKAFGYQSLKKHYLMKPRKKYEHMPHFELLGTNKPWNDGIKGVTVIDTIEVVIPEWGLIVEVIGPKNANTTYVVKVNGKTRTIPFRFAECVDGFRENFLNIDFHPKSKTFLVLTTSFGLEVDMHSAPKKNTCYNGIAVDIPRHPALKGNMCGLFGGLNGWNDNPNDDHIDAHGKAQPLDFMWSWAFGDSWIVPGGGGHTEKCVIDAHEQTYKDRLAKVDPGLKNRTEQLCRVNLQENVELVNCAKITERQVLSVEDCMTDSLFLETEEEIKDYVDAIVKHFEAHCDKPLAVNTPK